MRRKTSNARGASIACLVMMMICQHDQLLHSALPLMFADKLVKQQNKQLADPERTGKVTFVVERR